MKVSYYKVGENSPWLLHNEDGPAETGDLMDLYALFGRNMKQKYYEAIIGHVKKLKYSGYEFIEEPYPGCIGILIKPVIGEQKPPGRVKNSSGGELVIDIDGFTYPATRSKAIFLEKS